MIFSQRISLVTLVTLLSLAVYLPHDSFAANTNEEQSCLKYMQEYIKKDPRYGGLDISKARVGDISRDTADLSDYEDGFLKNRQKKSGNGGLYAARRNNIGTIIAQENFIITQFVTFGDRAAFRFPLPTERKGSSLS